MSKKKSLLENVIALSDSGEYQKIIDLLPNNVLKKEKNGELFFYRAWAHLQLNDNKIASEFFESANELEPDLKRKFNQLGITYYNKLELYKAINEYEKALALDNNFTIALYNRGLAYYDLKEFNKSIADCNSAILLDPNYSHAYIVRGLSWYYKNEFNKAIDDYNAAILLDPGYTDAFFNRALAFYYKGEYGKAIADYTKSIELNENYFLAYYNRGLAWYKLNDFNKAIADYEKTLLINPEYSNAYHSRGLVWYYLGDYNKAIDDYSKTIELDKNYTRAYYNRGLAWYNLLDNDKAIENYSNAIELDPDYTDAYFNRALAFYYKGEYEKAIDDYDRVILAQPDNADAYLNRGLAWNYKAKYDKAIADYNEVLSRKSDYKGLAYINRGIAYYYKGQYNEAIEDYTSALKINDSTEYVYNNRGLAWFNKGFYNEAIDDYNIALQLKPDYPDAYINRAMVWYDKDEYEKSIDDCTKALDLNMNLADAYNIRGSSRYFLKEFDKAAEDFQKIIGFFGYRAIGNTNMGDISSAKGDFQKAKEYYEEAEKDFNIPDWLKIPLKQKTDRNNQRLLLLKTNVPAEELAKQVHIEDRTEKVLQNIKKISKSDTRNVVHYTKIFVADIYVSSLDSKMHYSNAIYMNDPMEGQVVFDYFNEKKIIEAYLEGEKRYENSVYLGSFLPAQNASKGKSHEDELVMWRTYGKDENGKEAAGCNLVLSSEFFRQTKKQEIRDFSGVNTDDEQLKLAVVKEDYSMNKTVDEELLNVIYVEFHNKTAQIKNDPSGNLKPLMEELKKLLNLMIELREKCDKNEFTRYIENTLFKKLSTISFLFKSADYIYENEVRVIKTVPRDSEFIKSREVNIPGLPRKRFYIESNNEILPYIQKIFLGPKVENHQQWGLYFDFEIRQRAKELAGMKIPPFELHPSQIEILKSECKFQ
jgi:tetratricopeptide (TPR) repeat protein